MPSLALDDDVPSCSMWPWRRRRHERTGWAPLSDGSLESEKSRLSLPAYEPSTPLSPSTATTWSRSPLSPRDSVPPPLPPRGGRLLDAYATLAPLPQPHLPPPLPARPHPNTPPHPLPPQALQAGHTGLSMRSTVSGRSHSSSISQGSTTSGYMSLDADPFDDPESPARVAYLNARLAALQHYTFTSRTPVGQGQEQYVPHSQWEQPTSLLDIQDPKARAPVRVAASLGDAKMASLSREERRLQRARAEADAWRHEANLVYHQLCAARILALERMYERNAWRERCEAVEDDLNSGERERR